MQVEQIQAQIEEAKVVEQRRRVLYRAIVNLARQNGAAVGDVQVRQVIDVVTAYIERAPALMLRVKEAATTEGAQPCIQPLLDAIEEFFLEPNDIIPDQLGLAGLLDDAYLTHTLLQAISDHYESRSGTPLFTNEAYELNTFIRRLIGEPFVSMLDEHVTRTMKDLCGARDEDEMMTAIGRMDLSLAPGDMRGSARVAEILGMRI